MKLTTEEKRNRRSHKINYYKMILREELKSLFPSLANKARNVMESVNSFILEQHIKKTLTDQKFTKIDIDKIIWIDPKRIVYHTNYKGKDSKKTPFRLRVFHPEKDVGSVVGGDWDLSPYKFTDLDVYKAIEARIMKGTEWEETDYCRKMKKDISQGISHWHIYDEKRINERWDFLDDLIKSIKINGYIPNFERERSENDTKDKFGEVEVNIGRNGQFLFNDGRNRLAIAKVLSIPEIPVKILVRHTEWQEFKERLYLYAKKQKGKLYQPPSHPDLEEIPSWHECEDRFNAIIKEIPKTKGNLMDIGANLGYFCKRFEEVGFNSYAIEESEETVYFLKKLKEIDNNDFNVIDRSIFDTEIYKEVKFDVVLALNIFHHFLKTKAIFKKFLDLLRDLNSDIIIFEPHDISESQMVNAYKNFPNKEFVDLIKKYTGLNSHKLIYIAKDGRRIYKIY